MCSTSTMASNILFNCEKPSLFLNCNPLHKDQYAICCMPNFSPGHGSPTTDPFFLFFQQLLLMPGERCHIPTVFSPSGIKTNIYYKGCEKSDNSLGPRAARFSPQRAVMESTQRRSEKLQIAKRTATGPTD